MFTGIIETTGKVNSIEQQSNGIIRLGVESGISGEFRIDQSVSHDGVCLTVVEIENNTHFVQMVPETLSRSRFRELKQGDLLNLERSMTVNARLDGHFVQGHVDAVGELQSIDKQQYFKFTYPTEYSNLLVDKGSVSINGVSLTVAGIDDDWFRVALIPYTLEHTNLGRIKPGDSVNLEFDILGKYVARQITQLTRTHM